MGRRKNTECQEEVIRISQRVRFGLQKVKRDYRMPSRYTENEIIQAILKFSTWRRNITSVISVI